MSIIPSSPTAPLMSVRLSTKIVPEYRRFVADTADDESWIAWKATVDPNAACNVARTDPAAVSFKNVTVIVSDEK